MSYSMISVLIPTRGRIPRLQKMMDSFEATTDRRNSEMVFRVDEDDTETQEFLERRWLWSSVVGPRLDGYKSMPQYFIDMLPAAQGDVLMVGNDDMVFNTQGWDTLILEEARRYERDGIFNIGVRTMNATHFPFSVISRRTAETLGFVYDPRIFWGDIYLRDVMMEFGRAVLLPTVHIDHDWAGNAPDKTFEEANALKMSIGTTDYWERHRAVVLEAVEKLRGVAS